MGIRYFSKALSLGFILGDLITLSDVCESKHRSKDEPEEEEKNRFSGTSKLADRQGFRFEGFHVRMKNQKICSLGQIPCDRGITYAQDRKEDQYLKHYSDVVAREIKELSYSFQSFGSQIYLWVIHFSCSWHAFHQ